jgi:hypothetical protein
MALENLNRKEEIEYSTDRTFGLVFSVFFGLIAFWPLVKGGRPRLIAVVLAVFFLMTALLRPSMLAVLNRFWQRLGLFISAVVSPLALGILFYFIFTPVGILMRIFGKRPLHLEFDSKADSYWIWRNPPGPDGSTFNNQF